MGRLADKLSKANDAIAAIETAVEKDVEKLIERTKAVQRKSEDVFMKKHEHLDRHMTDLSEFENDLDDFAKNDRSEDGANSEGNAYKSAHPKV